jgi:hypothetical protein
VPYSTLSCFLFTDLKFPSNKKNNTFRSRQLYILCSFHAVYIDCVTRLLELRLITSGPLSTLLYYLHDPLYSRGYEGLLD